MHVPFSHLLNQPQQSLQQKLKIQMLKALQAIQSMDYLKCPNPQHEHSPLSLLCADPICPSPSLLCIHCESQSHPSHSILPLKHYLRKLLIATRVDLEQQNLIMYTEQIEKSRDEIVGVLESFREEVVGFVDGLIADVGMRYREIGERVREVVGVAGRVEKFLGLYGLVVEDEMRGQQGTVDGGKDKQQRRNMVRINKEMNKQLQHILQYAKIESYEPTPSEQPQPQQPQKCYKISSLSAQIKSFSESFSSKCKRCLTLLKKSSEQLHSISKPSLYKILEQPLPTVQPLKPTKFTWSQTLRTAAIAINGDTVQRKTGLSMERFALFNEELRPYVERKRKAVWVVKVVKLAGWIGLGVCLKEKIVGGGYKFTYENLGHGSYMVSSNGYSWSSSVKTSNSAYFSTFSFTTGDFIILQFDPTTQPTYTLNFYILKQPTLLSKSQQKSHTGPTIQIPTKYLSKSQNPTQHQPPIVLGLGNLEKSHSLALEACDDYYPCVNLCSVGDSVQIVG